MTQIRYLIGDATNPQTAGPAVIAHVCNDIGAWGAGFVLALSRRWKEPEAAYKTWAATRGQPGSDFSLGGVQIVAARTGLWVANMIGQSGIQRKNGTPPVRYEAISFALKQLADYALDYSASVHMPRIGCGLAGGKWEEIEPLIEQRLCAAGVAVTVYDLP